MKKLFLFAVVAFLCCMSAQAQKVKRFGAFNHASIGISAGTTGVGAELALPLSDFIALRGGYTFLPEVKRTADVHYKAHGVKQETEVEGKIKWGNGHVLLDLYPIKSLTLHATLGAYFGTDEVLTAENLQPLVGIEPGEGLEIGDYIVGPDKDGIARASIKVKKFKPYFGIGFGRAVPRHRVGFSGNIGVQMWGNPEVCDRVTGQVVTSEDTGNKDDDAINTISKVSVWPVIELKLAVRLF